MTGPKPDPRDVETRPISVAELLAKNGVYAHLYETQFLSAETMPSYVPAS